ncbi:unnamed protein product [[Candida] boidinii]|uniref:Unnamed protein product n=1 Tax=Candida boidinii TaxID=5477 RepID=A0A9W6SV50_CANBO|nr:hypothetical protein B5S30_g3314 [[Candida] boidinii]OWB85882.1 hypothetical protein B5S33_g4557 [[Candida] boidinii]GME67296.1 unnamed protein product [[Candida] boidinii]
MGINNPIPRSLKSECVKAAKILSSFIKPNQVLGADEIIPHEVLLNAKGLAVMTVLKAGFLFSGRAGSGVVVARLPDGSWSAPSALVTAGAGAGGQIGAELTDFVFILNTDAAVESFAQYGSVTLGGNVSVAAGPLGRNAEVAGSASLKNVAAVFSYSKTKGLFAGVSVEGSVLVERREANRKFYGDQCKARQILSGRVDPPPACDPLMRILDSRAFSRLNSRNDDGEYYSDDDDYYNDIPSTFSDDSSTNYSRRRGNSTSAGARRSSRRNNDDDYDDYDDDDNYYSRRRGPSSPGNSSYNNNSHNTGSHARNSSNSWEDDVYDRYDSKNSRSSHKNTNSNSNSYRPRSEKPDFGNGSGNGNGKSSSGSGAGSSGKKAIALYSFDAQQPGDLPFKKGDVITILQRSDSTDDWWTGRNNGKEGIFPANYVELV